MAGCARLVTAGLQGADANFNQLAVHLWQVNFGNTWRASWCESGTSTDMYSKFTDGT